MAADIDYFSDLLLPGEAVTAALSAPGQPEVARVGQHPTWWHVAFTQTRFLVVKFRQRTGSNSWQPMTRYAVDKATIRIARYPRTPQSAARLEIVGGAEPIVLMDIDSPAVFPQIEPFLAAYGRAVEGAGLIAQREIDDEEFVRTDGRKLLIVGLISLASILLCCGGSSIIYLIRMLLA